MLKPAKLSARARALLIGGVVVVGAFAGSALAGAPAPTAHIVDGTGSGTLTTNEDGLINAAEVAAKITVTGTYDNTAAITAIQVYVASGSLTACPLDNALLYKDATLNALDGTWTAGLFDVAGYADGTMLCARARSSTDGIGFTELATSDNRPIKDTVVLAGTAELVDPNNDGFLNIAENAASTVLAKYTASGPDATAADDFYRDQASAIRAGCGAAPTVLADYDQPASKTGALLASCVTALDNDQPFTYNAQWRDLAGNTSTEATSNALIKDLTAPTTTIVVETSPLNAANVASVTIKGAASEGGSTIAVSASDGINTVSGSTTANGAGAWTKTLNLTSLKDGTITAKACPTDLASNPGPCPTANPAKDATPPGVPAVLIEPKSITQINQTFVEVTVSGESGAQIKLTVDDENSVTPALEAFSEYTQTLGSSLTYTFNVSGLNDGIITATALLKDSFLNVSPAGIDTAIKNTALPAITIESPAANSLNKAVVNVAGTAIPGASITLKDETGTKLNKNPINASANSIWSAQLSYTKSGSHTLKAQTNVYVGAGKDVAYRSFDVDARNPGVTVTTENNKPFQSGEAVILEGAASDDFSGVLAVNVVIFDIRNNEITTGPVPSVPSVRLNKAVVDQNASCPACGPQVKAVSWSFDASALPRGYYSVQVTSFDRAGNKSTQPATMNFLKLG